MHCTFTATASYRLLPEIILTKPVRGEKAKKLAKCFSKGVVKVVKGEDGESYAKVVNPRRDTCSREVFRHEDLKDCVQLSRVRDHFICESKAGSQMLMIGAIRENIVFLENCLSDSIQVRILCSPAS